MNDMAKNTELNDRKPFLELENMPLNLDEIDSNVLHALRKVEYILQILKTCTSHYKFKNSKNKWSKLERSVLVTKVQKAAELARELTFPFLNSPLDASSHVGAYAASCCYVAESLLCGVENKSDQERTEMINAAFRALDLAMLRGGVVKWGPIAESISKTVPMDKKEDILSNKSHSKRKVTEKKTLSNKKLKTTLPFIDDPLSKPIPRVDGSKLTIEEFRKLYMEKKQPVILTKVLNSWPALNLWNDLAYLKSKAVGRLVPVETVAKEDASISFLSKTWSHEVMPLNDYIDQYFAQDDGNGKDTPHGYLAQHPLLDQIPSLRDDIRIPPFCYSHTKEDEDSPSDCEFAKEPLISAWFGPTGTVSPLHNDPYQNVLAQIVGRKYLRIYDACHTDHLYPHISHLGHNSSIDLENPNHKKYPLFSKTPSWQTILQPGDLLYIPRHAWHYVRSLETSFSASFWFGAKMELVKDSDGIYKGKYVCKDE